MPVLGPKNIEQKMLKEVDFDGACKSINELRSLPYERSDIEVAQRRSICELLTNMLVAGFQAKRARELIADATSTHDVIRQWTKFVKRPQNSG